MQISQPNHKLELWWVVSAREFSQRIIESISQMSKTRMTVEEVGVSRKDTAIFTISSNNYMAYSSTLINSSVKAHVNADHFICLADHISEIFEIYPPYCKIIQSCDIGIPEFDSFAFRYDIMEFNTAIKPFMILYLMSLGYDQVIYFDPDIKIYKPVEKVFSALRNGAPVVLTPHLTGPLETDTPPDDVTIMRAGIYNLGFVAFSRQPGVERILHWWARRLRYQCINAQEEGIFVDQKFMDLVPGFLPDVAILRDTGLNAAYWNLIQRDLSESDDGWLVDGESLGFFHFSGYDPRNSARLSKHTTMFSDKNPAALNSLLADYRADLVANRLHIIPRGGYAYEAFDSGARITTDIRRLFRDTYLTWAGNPFSGFEHHLNQIALGTPIGVDGRICTIFMKYLWENSSYLRSTFDIGSPVGVTGLSDWFIRHGQESGIDRRLAGPTVERLAETRRNATASNRSRGHGETTISVIGYLTTDTGVGEVGRQTLLALAEGARRVDGLDVSLNVASSRNNRKCEHLLSDEADGDLQIFNINADQLPLVQKTMAASIRSDAYRIAVPFWELASFPDEWISAFDNVDEIWAPSRFIQQSLITKVDKPVLYMPVPLDFSAQSQFDRAHFGLTDDIFLFLCSLDFLSYCKRKNPGAALAAFEKAFLGQPMQQDVGLVIKCTNSKSSPAEWLALLSAANPRLKIFFVDETLSRDEILSLVRLTDCVVSLHRSEGLGLLVAEAMSAGIPVVSTDYSATTELVSVQTGFPVDFKMQLLEPGDYPFADGKVWADPDITHAAWQMRRVFEGRDKQHTLLDNARDRIQKQHAAREVLLRYEARIEELGF